MNYPGVKIGEIAGKYDIKIVGFVVCCSNYYSDPK